MEAESSGESPMGSGVRRAAVAIPLAGLAVLLAWQLWSDGQGEPESTPRAPAPRASMPVPSPSPSPAPPKDPPPAPAPPADEDRATGRVLDEERRPIADAVVVSSASRPRELVLPGGAQFLDWEVEERTTSTAPDGTFLLEGLTRSLPHTLRVSAGGRAATLLDFDPAPYGPGTIALGDIVLNAGRTLSGQALDGTGTHLAGRTITLLGSNEDRSRLRPGAPPADSRTDLVRRKAITDASGGFQFRELAPGPYLLRLVLEGAEPVEETVRVPGDRDVGGVVLRLPTGRSIRFRLRDAQGRPASGVAVRTSGPVQPTVAALADEEGLVVLRGLPERGIDFLVSEQRVLGRDLRYSSIELGPIVPAGQELVVVVPEPAPIRGTVVDDSGRPLDGMYVNVLQDGRPRYGLTVACDAEGRFRLDLAAGTTVDLRVDGTRGIFQEVEYPAGKMRQWRTNEATLLRGTAGPVTAPSEGVVLRCATIRTDSTLAVRVVDPDGVPVSGVGLAWPGASGWQRAETDSSGTARIAGLEADSLRLFVERHPDAVRERDWYPPDTLEVVPEGQVAEMRYRRGRVVTGTVRTEDGRPAGGASVSIDAPVTEFIGGPLRTDAEGRFRVVTAPDLAIKTLFVSWSEGAALHTCERLSLRAAESPFDLVLRRVR